MSSVDTLKINIKELSPSRESIPYHMIHVDFRNDNSRPVKIKGYKIVWSGSSEDIILKKTIPPNDSLTSSARFAHGQPRINYDSVQVIPK